ncbi:hypothetical protein BSM4216_3606 [Bacillus smithii]|nr:hypothetical protein BSM4216_3606 [Bacillus smithii]
MHIAREDLATNRNALFGHEEFNQHLFPIGTVVFGETSFGNLFISLFPFEAGACRIIKHDIHVSREIKSVKFPYNCISFLSSKKSKAR